MEPVTGSERPLLPQGFGGREEKNKSQKAGSKAQGSNDSEVAESAEPHISELEENLRELMYAYGDSADPLMESVDLMKSMITEFVRDLIQDSFKVASGDVVKFPHIRYVLRKDHPKHYHAKERYQEYKEANQSRRKRNTFVTD
ncbi:hypothetical protein AAMO2058_000367600 [Amorphochlora amoebiformis]